MVQPAAAGERTAAGWICVFICRLSSAFRGSRHAIQPHARTRRVRPSPTVVHARIGARARFES